MDNRLPTQVQGTITGRVSSQSFQHHTESPRELPKSCWGLAKLCLSLIGANFRLQVQVEKYRRDSETLAKIRQSVGMTREALEQMIAAERALRSELLDASGLEIGKDYNLHYHHRTDDNG